MNGSASQETTSLQDWLESRQRQTRLVCKEIAWNEIRDWRMADGIICHQSGRFFSICGIRASSNFPGLDGVEQPMIDQPEIGILGVLVRRVGNVPEVLVQAKPEPGNVGVVQLAPTVQATKSNYCRVHGGRPTQYLEYFLSSRRLTIVADTHQSEQGALFFNKFNRNMTVVVDDEGPAAVNAMWSWQPFVAVQTMLRSDFCVNTDFRSTLVSGDWHLLSGENRPFEGRRRQGDWGEQLYRSFYSSEETAENTQGQLQARLEHLRKRTVLTVAKIPLSDLTLWETSKNRLAQQGESPFQIRPYHVQLAEREVPEWEQPLLATVGKGTVILLCQVRRGVLHFLFRAGPEIGFRDRVQLGPSVQADSTHSIDGDYIYAGNSRRYLWVCEESGHEHTGFLQSDEGGRFYRSLSRYSIVQIPENEQVPEDPYAFWMTLAQVHTLTKVSGFFTNEARSAISLLLYYL